MRTEKQKIVNLFTQILIWKLSKIKTKENEEKLCVLCEWKERNTTRKKNIKEIHFQVFVDKHYAYKHTQTHSYTHISILKTSIYKYLCYFLYFPWKNSFMEL